MVFIAMLAFFYCFSLKNSLHYKLKNELLMKKLSVLLVLALFHVCSYAQGASSMMANLINEGKVSELSGNYSGAEDAYLSALSIDSNAAEVHVLLGKLHHTTNKYNLALKELDKALEINEENPDAFFTRGNIYVDMGSNHLAIQDYSKSIELDPSAMEYYMSRGFASAQLGLFNDATNDFAIAIQVNKVDAVAYYNFIRVQGLDMLQNNCTYAQTQMNAGNMQAELVVSTFCF
jgi:tetratricopeptide (TPR) repeat protein